MPKGSKEPKEPRGGSPERYTSWSSRPAWTGWIIADLSDAPALRCLGVVLSRYDNDQEAFEGVVLSEETLHAMDEADVWGHWIWGLREMEGMRLAGRTVE